MASMASGSYSLGTTIDYSFCFIYYRHIIKYRRRLMDRVYIAIMIHKAATLALKSLLARLTHWRRKAFASEQRCRHILARLATPGRKAQRLSRILA